MRHSSEKLMYFFENLQNIGRYTSVILVHTSGKYLMLEQHYSVNFSQKLQNIGRFISVSAVQKSRKYLIFEHQTWKISQHSCLILVQISRKYLIFGPHYSVNLIYVPQKL